MRPNNRLLWSLVVCCVGLAACSGLAFLFNGDIEPGDFVLPDNDVACSPDLGWSASLSSESTGPVVAPDDSLARVAARLLAAVPGGLCLLL